MFRYGLLVMCLVMTVGCGRKHPVEVFIHPDMEKGTIEKIAVFPFASTLHHADDPDGGANYRQASTDLSGDARTTVLRGSRKIAELLGIEINSVNYFNSLL